MHSFIACMLKLHQIRKLSMLLSAPNDNHVACTCDRYVHRRT